MRYRQLLKQFRVLVYLKRNILDRVVDCLNRSVNMRNLRIIESFPIYVPDSDGSYKNIARLTVLAGNQVFPFLNHLVEVTGKNRLSCMVQAENFCVDEA